MPERLLRFCVGIALASSITPAGRLFELSGRIIPETRAAVSLFGATTPFHTAALTDSRGRFRFRELLPGSYTLAVFIPGRGEARRTVEIGPGTADAKRHVSVNVEVDAKHLLVADALRGQATVSARELSIPRAARDEYQEAQKKLSRRDVAAAVAHLDRAVEIAPQFSLAWNNLGTIAYQSRQYPHAEECFRKALAQDPGSYEPLVNLGGVLLTEGKFDDALNYNLFAVHARANDALANSQLGLNYFALGNLELGQKYLETAEHIDPAHFSYPQLTLAEIHLRRHEPAAAARELRDFLQRHPDAPQAASVREALTTVEK